MNFLTQGVTTIRLLRDEAEQKEVKRWWAVAGVEMPDLSYIPRDYTYVVDVDGKAMTAVTLVRTILPVLWLECLIGNPDVPRPEGKKYVSLIAKFAEEKAREWGYKSLFCMAPNDALARYYKQFGFIESLPHVSTLLKEVR